MADDRAESQRRLIRRLRQQVAELQADAERLDWLGENTTRVADSERYLPRSVCWGKGVNLTIRQAIDKARKPSGEQ